MKDQTADLIITSCRLLHHLLVFFGVVVSEAQEQKNLGCPIRAAIEVLLGRNDTDRTPKVWRTEAQVLTWWLQEGAGKDYPPLPTAVIKAAISLIRERARSETPDLARVLNQFVREIRGLVDESD